MRLMGARELPGGWHFDSLHVPGVLNDVADGVFRGGTPVISVEALPPSVPLSIGRNGTWESKVGSCVSCRKRKTVTTGVSGGGDLDDLRIPRISQCAPVQYPEFPKTALQKSFSIAAPVGLSSGEIWPLSEILFVYKNLPFLSVDSLTQGFSTTLARRRSSYPDHKVEKYAEKGRNKRKKGRNTRGCRGACISKGD